MRGVERSIYLKTRPMLRIEQRLGEPLEAFLERRYVEEGKTQREIGVELGVNDSTVNRWMAALGIEARFPGQRGKVAVA